MNIENAEKNLWDQIRSVTQVQMRVIQGGITILSGFLVAIAFYRKENAEYLNLSKGEPYPFSQWIIGFLILLGISFIFFKMLVWVRGRLFFYIQALKGLPEEYGDTNYKIYPQIPEDKNIVRYTNLVFWVFPAIDFIVYCFHWFGYLFHILTK